MRKPAVIIFCLLLLATLGCKKETISQSDKKTRLNVTATVKYAGPIAADGCGWVVEIDSAYYHPDNLADQYAVNNLKINVSYDLLNTRFQCGLLPLSAANPGMLVIHINKINQVN